MVTVMLEPAVCPAESVTVSEMVTLPLVVQVMVMLLVVEDPEHPAVFAESVQV